MRILHVFDHSLPLQSGYVSRSMGIVRSQKARGWDPILLTTPRYQPSPADHETIDDQIFHRSKQVHVSAPALRELAEMQETKRRLAEIIRTEQPDILHAHSPVLNALPAISAGRRFGLPVVYEVRAFWEDAAVDHGTARGGGPRYRISRLLETYALKRVERVIALCEPLRAEIMARGISSERVSIVPNAVDPAFLVLPSVENYCVRERLGISSQTVVLGFIGSFYAYEGLDLLLEAVPVLIQRIPQLLVLLVGGGPDEERLRRIVRELSIERFVRFTGRVHHQEVASYCSVVDVFVFPRRRIRLTDLVTPLKPLEAMAQSKPVIASNVGGHCELIRDSDTGYLFAADDANALAAKVEAVIANGADRARVALNGRKFVEKERTWDVVVQRYASVYSQLLRGKMSTQ